MKRTLLILLIIIISAVLVIRIALYGPGNTPQHAVPAALQSLLLPSPRTLDGFSLTDHNGQTLGPEQLKGQWNFVFFGYTHCPDVCPTTLGTLKGLANKLTQTPLAENTRFLFVSVDPKRDTPAHLRDYIRHFHPDFVAATGQREMIDRLARQLNVVYLFDGDTASDNYIVNHSASVALLDPQARWVARFNPPFGVQQLLSDYLQLYDYLSQQPHQDD